MVNTILLILSVVVQVVGFIFICKLGAQVSDKLTTKSRWLSLAVGSAFIIGAGLIAFFVGGHPLTYTTQTMALFCIAFGGGVVARERSRIIGDDN